LTVSVRARIDFFLQNEVMLLPERKTDTLKSQKKWMRYRHINWFILLVEIKKRKRRNKFDLITIQQQEKCVFLF